MRTLLCVVVAMALILPAVGCQSTTVSTVWRSPDPAPLQEFKKVVTIVLNTSPGERRAAEDELARDIRSAKGIPAYTIIPDEDLTDRAKVKAILEQNGIQGAVVLRLVAVDKSSTYYPPSYANGYDFYSFSPYQLYYTNPGRTVTNETFSAEISIYSVTESRLLWAGSSSTTDPENIQDLARQVAGATREELKRQGLIH